MRKKRLWISGVGAVLTIAITVGVAFALWTVSGSGSGAGAATAVKGLVVTPDTPTGAGASLYPGGPAGPVFLTIQNTNPFPVTVTGLSWGTPTSTITLSCASSNIGLAEGAPTTASIPVPANSTTSAVEIPGVLELAKTAPPGCQGVAFDVSVSVTGTQE